MVKIDMEMPKRCGDCFFRDGMNERGFGCFIEDYTVVKMESKPDWCPLIPDEPKTAKWIFAERGVGYECSECFRFSHLETDYCPNCGAKMEDADEET